MEGLVQDSGYFKLSPIEARLADSQKYCAKEDEVKMPGLLRKRVLIARGEGLLGLHLCDLLLAKAHDVFCVHTFYSSIEDSIAHLLNHAQTESYWGHVNPIGGRQQKHA